MPVASAARFAFATFAGERSIIAKGYCIHFDFQQSAIFARKGLL